MTEEEGEAVAVAVASAMVEEGEGVVEGPLMVLLLQFAISMMAQRDRVSAAINAGSSMLRSAGIWIGETADLEVAGSEGEDLEDTVIVAAEEAAR